MPLVLGIDEAGYGPLLGPLVVGATLWQAPPETLAADWWDLLSPAVARGAAGAGARLPVGDSKKIFERKHGLISLERPVLAFAHAAGLRWHTLGELLAALGYAAPTTAVCPWYADLSPAVPSDPARSAFAGAAGRLAATLGGVGLVCRALRAAIMTEDVFNERVRKTQNKADVLLEAVLRLMYWAGGVARNQDLHVRVDRLGGRADYRRALMAAFPERHLHELAADETCSRYRLASQDNDWHVEFATGGEARHLPIALASMLAKYVRELLMERFNTYWRRRSPSVAATAGYYTDAQRFLAEIQPVAARDGLALDAFVRAR